MDSLKGRKVCLCESCSWLLYLCFSLPMRVVTDSELAGMRLGRGSSYDCFFLAEGKIKKALLDLLLDINYANAFVVHR